ncbi:MAG: hypothetical protein RMK99_06875 [Anaerolineales bacterium]|nr:hypothetical protein [Anaerolineales bacterium]
MNDNQWWLLFVALSTFFAGVGQAIGRAVRIVEDDRPYVRFGGAYSPLLTWLRYGHLPATRLDRAVLYARLILVSEWSAIVVWVAWVGRNYLDLRSDVWPLGREFALVIQTHDIWRSLLQCGACVFWNGSFHGGAPAFAELQGAVLHPLVILTTPSLGLVNGSKVLLLFSLWLAGMAQWHLARVLRLGPPARLWAAGLTIAGGHLSARMELGLVGMVVSLASFSLCVALAAKLAYSGRRRITVLFALALALTLVSGQGYVQIGLVLVLVPALAALLLTSNLKLRAVWREFALAGFLALALSGIYLVPLLHFLPQTGKWLDPNFSAAQTWSNTLLNLLIDDPGYYYSEVSGRPPHPSVYANYFGWVPLAFIAAGFGLAERRHMRFIAFALVGATFAVLAASAISLRWLALLLPEIAYSVRYTPLLLGMAYPFLTGLAALGFHQVLHRSGPHLALALSGRSHWKLPALSVAGFAVAVYGLYSVYTFSQHWYKTVTVPRLDHIKLAQAVSAQVEASQSDQWVQIPYAEAFWTPAVLEARLRVGLGSRPWWWRNRPLPPNYAIATRGAETPEGYRQVDVVDDIRILVNPNHLYAAVETEQGKTPCRAQGRGGDIRITCSTQTPGRLFVYEYNWPGWSARVNGAPVALHPGDWLSIDVPAGESQIEFFYRPWDVPLGAAFTGLGLAACVYLWMRSA